MSDSAALVPPRLLLGAIVLFWGWQCELYVQAAVMALCLEAAPLLGVRFSLTAREYGRFSDLCVVLLLGQGLYLYLTPDRSAPLLVIGQWLPMTFFPLALAEAFSEKRRITLAAFFPSLRRKRDLARKSPLTFSFSPLYAFAALLAAGCAQHALPPFLSHHGRSGGLVSVFPADPGATASPCGSASSSLSCSADISDNRGYTKCSRRYAAGCARTRSSARPP